MKIILTLTAILTLFVACKKDAIIYEVEGTITSSTGGALSDATVELDQQILSGSTTNAKYSFADEEVTDALGYYNASGCRIPC